MNKSIQWHKDEAEEFRANFSTFPIAPKGKELFNEIYPPGELIVIFGKFFLHKNSFLKMQPNFSTFHKELSLFFISEINEQKNALKLCK